MGNCVYCGKPAGFLRRRHKECEERHRQAVSSIPAFFSKVVANPISSDRFSELLNATAKASFISPEQLKELCVAGMNNIIEAALKERPPSEPELNRIADLSESLGRNFRDGLGIDERLIKIGILSKLYDGKLSDSVVVEGPMPIKMALGEAIIWIFNRTRSYDAPSNDDAKDDLPINLASPDDAHYFGLDLFKNGQAPRKTLSKADTGDLILTNKNIYFLQSEETQTRIPVSRITYLRPYSDGLQIGWRAAQPKSLLVLFDDPWFAANVAARLIQLARR